MRAISDLSCELPRFWSRYPERASEEMVSGLVRLLSVGGPSRKVVYPAGLMAAVDPTAKWMRRWAHGGLGRKLLFK